MYECAVRSTSLRSACQDEDGRISADDVAKLLTSNGEGSYTTADAKVVIARADTVGDGSVDFVEFLTFVAAHAKPGMLRSGQLTPEDDEKSMRAAFDKFSGGAASVSLEAFATVAKKLKEPWADGAVRSLFRLHCCVLALA